MELDELMHQLLDAAQEAAYAAVGFGLIGFQRAQVHRRELQRTTQGLLEELGGESPELAHLVGATLGTASSIASGASAARRELASRLCRLVVEVRPPPGGAAGEGSED